MSTVARELLRRYPGLRQSWPVQRVTDYRQRHRWRANPRRMASWFRDADDMHTRLFVSNLEMPEAPDLCQTANIVVRLLDSDGARLYERRHAIARNGSLVLELGQVLPQARRNRVESGQVQLDFEGQHLGSSRAYLHWYNAHGLTSSHEKYGVTIPAVGGYWTVPNVQDNDNYSVRLAVTNLDGRPYSSDVILKDDESHELHATVNLPANGSRFLRLDELFGDPRGFLHDQPGVLYFGNNHQPAMYYYFVYNARAGTWRAQHL